MSFVPEFKPSVLFKILFSLNEKLSAYQKQVSSSISYTVKMLLTY